MASSMPGDDLRYCCYSASPCEGCHLFASGNSVKQPLLLFPVNWLFPLCAVPVRLHDCSEFSFSSVL